MCASLAEDRYGVVQRDIPKIVEALLSFLGALEEYQEELNKKYALPPAEELTGLSAKEVAQKETLAMEAARASEVLGVVSDGELRCMRRLWVGLTSASGCGTFSDQGRGCAYRADVWGQAGCVQVPAEDSEEAAGVRGLQLI